jgi:hypothetical protein
MQHNLCGIVGKFGSGKTLYALELGLKLACEYNKPLVVNFDVDHKAVRSLARFMGFTQWACIGRIIRIELFDSLMPLWERHNCVIVFDEAGVLANSRNWQQTPKAFLQNLFQIRHLNIHLLVVFQFYEQIDRQLREVFQLWIVCYSVGQYDKKLQLPKIYFRRAFHYTPEKFLRLENDIQARGSLIRPWLWSSKTYWRFLPLARLQSLLFALLDVIRFLLIAFSGRLPSSVLARSILEDRLFLCFSSKGLVGSHLLPARLHRIVLWPYE